MTMDPAKLQTPKKNLVLIAWIIAILISLLPDILFREITGSLPIWVFWAKVGFGLVFLLLCAILKALRPLWKFSVVLLAVLVLDWIVGRFYSVIGYTTWLARAPKFIQDVGSVQIQRATTGILFALLMLLVFGRFKRFFLVKGDLKAQALPIPWVLTRPPKWNILAPLIALAMSLGLFVFTLIFGTPITKDGLKGILPLLPFVLIFAASNAFGEEMIYRAPWIGALEEPVGGTNALLIPAVFFGLAHFYGVPFGITGVIMAFIPGWLMGKAMRETRGFFWAWFIHFCMDVTIFFFIAMGSVKPGG